MSSDALPRILLDGATTVHANLALEEAILEGNAGLVLRIWSNERSIVIGRAQLARYETDLAYCQENRIPVVRRLTAGGAVYNGPGNVNWSLFVGRAFASGSIRYIWGVREVFRMAGEIVAQASGACGVEAWLEAPNRVISRDGKVSGMAAYISRLGLLCHGTFLLEADLELAKRLTDPSSTSLDRRYTRSNAMKMANTGIRLPSFIAAMRGVVAERTGLEIETTQPTGGEISAMGKLLPKYLDPHWSLGDPFEV